MAVVFWPYPRLVDCSQMLYIYIYIYANSTFWGLDLSRFLERFWRGFGEVAGLMGHRILPYIMHVNGLLPRQNKHSRAVLVFLEMFWREILWSKGCKIQVFYNGFRHHHSILHSFLRIALRKPCVLRGFLRPMLRKPCVLHGFPRHLADLWIFQDLGRDSNL